MQQRAEHRHLELEPVPLVAPGVRRDVPPEGKNTDDRDRHECGAMMPDEAGRAHDNPRGPWNVVAQGLKQRREIRDHEDRDDDHRHRDGADHDERIAYGTLHPVVDILVVAQVLTEPRERIVERAGGFSDAHHADEQRREDLRVAGERGCEITPGLEAVKHVVQRIAQQCVVS
jgi:hypothetical protein